MNLSALAVVFTCTVVYKLFPTLLETDLSTMLWAALVLVGFKYAPSIVRSLWDSTPNVSVPLTTEESSDPTSKAITTGVMNLRTKDGSITCYDPASMQVIGYVPAMTAPQVRELVDKARAAQQTWKNTTFDQRRTVIRMIQRFFLENQEDICYMSMRETGKTRIEAMLGEILTTCGKADWVCSYGEDALKTERRPTSLVTVHKVAQVEYYPLGVIGVIAPNNYPIHNLYNHIISGLFTGNAVVAKVSEFTSFSASYCERIIKTILAKAGHSPDLVSIVTGFVEAGSGLVESGVDKIVFTGSVPIGKHIMRGASASLTPVVLELGGKDPFIICEDADLDQVVQTALRGTYQNAGQNCVGAERFYVYDSVHDEFVKRVTAVVSQFRQGAPLAAAPGEQIDIGATITPMQLDIIEELVNDAVTKGAKIILGGARNTSAGPGLFFQPTILTNVTHDMRIVTEEAFGPVMSIIRVPDNNDDECIRLVNALDFGLGSSVFTTDLSRAKRLSARIRSGMTNTNDFGVNYLIQSLPFGGVRDSGFGRFAGPEGLRALCLMKSTVTDMIPGLRTSIPPVLSYPTKPNSMMFCKGLVGLCHGMSLPERIAGIARLAKAAVTSK